MEFVRSRDAAEQYQMDFSGSGSRPGPRSMNGYVLSLRSLHY